MPLYRGHHREVHRCGDEAVWWKKAGIDPTVIARALWLETHPLPATSDKMGDVATSVATVRTGQTELNHLGSGDDAAIWAHRCLVEKNRLVAADAQDVEEAFQARLATFATHAADAVQQAPAESEQPPTPHRPDPNAPEKRPRSKVIDKSVLALPEPRRVRDRDHVKSVAKQPCLLCGRRPSDAHHLRFAQHPALGRKVSDEFAVPLCRGHHREVHRSGDEAAWWRDAGVDPTVTARALWLETHLLPICQSDGPADIGEARAADPTKQVIRR